MPEKHGWINTGLATILVVAVLASWFRLSDPRSAALDAQANLERMKTLAGRIETLRQNQTRAMLQSEQRIEDFNTWIDCIRAAGIDEKQLHTINRMPIQKFDKTDYNRDDVFIEVDGISSQQLVSLVLKCEDASMAYKAASVHLTLIPVFDAGQMESRPAAYTFAVCCWRQKT